MVPVIVLLEIDKNNKETLKTAKVRSTSYRKRSSDTPASKEEAAIKQHPDLEEAMINFAAKWAQVGTINTSNVIGLFLAELGEAQKKQKQLKHKARYRYVEYPVRKRGRDDLEETMSLSS